MKIIRPKRYIHLPNGKMRELCPGVLIKGTKVIPADPEKIAKANRKLAKKCKKQRENDAEAKVRFIPKELLQSSSTIKIIEPPKGQVSSKAAYFLENQISIQTEANNAAVKKQFEHMFVEGKF